MHRLKPVAFIWRMLPILLIALLLGTRWAQASRTWKLIPGANPGPVYNGLYGVAAVAPNDIWAVGAYSPAQNQYFHQPLIEQWNGTRWSVVPNPGPFPSVSNLNGVAAISAQDAWAVGDYDTGSAQKILIDHWNGTKWTMLSSPNPSESVNILNGVVALSASNVWAVGQYTNNITDFTEPLIEQWNGSAWAIAPSPKAGAGNAVLVSVAAASANSIWAVGSFDTVRGMNRALIEHWDGHKWNIMASPDPGQLGDVLSAVTVVSAQDVWAVGQQQSQTGFNTLVEHWNGKIWSVVKSPGPGSSETALYGVTAISANNIWAVGQDGQTPGGRTLIEHWNGKMWSVVPSPNGGSGNNILFAVARVPSTGKAWAVGQDAGQTTRTIIELHQ